MSDKLQLVFLGENYRISFEEIDKINDIEFLSLNDFPYPLKDIERNLFDFPSTNGLYTMYAMINKKRKRIYVATDSFKNKYLNDEPINTSTANPNIFYRGKHVNIKVFLTKQLLRAQVPGKFNNVEREVQTYDDIVKASLEKLSVKELKTILSNKGRPSSGRNKSQLIALLVRILK